jgi:death on curing protein
MIMPLWLELEQILIFHEYIIAETGGATGLRDEGLLLSALSRPQNLFAYEEATIFELAACYAEAIANNHPFIDGNKRSAFMAADTFLEQNGFILIADQEELADLMVNLANHKLSRAGVAAYFEQHSTPLEE